MGSKMIKLMSFGGLALTLAGTIVSAIASNKSQQVIIYEAVKEQLANLTK